MWFGLVMHKETSRILFVKHSSDRHVCKEACKEVFPDSPWLVVDFDVRPTVLLQTLLDWLKMHKIVEAQRMPVVRSIVMVARGGAAEILAGEEAPSETTTSPPAICFSAEQGTL